jgi:hypothetical protein
LRQRRVGLGTLYVLEKRLIGPKLIDELHTGRNIVEHIAIVVDEYGLTNKNIFYNSRQCFIKYNCHVFSKTIIFWLPWPCFFDPLDDNAYDYDDPDDLSTIFTSALCLPHN